MENRHAHKSQRPPPPPRTLSNSSYPLNHQQSSRPAIASRLQYVRTVSHSVGSARSHPDEEGKANCRNMTAFLNNAHNEHPSPDVICIDDDDDDDDNDGDDGNNDDEHATDDHHAPNYDHRPHHHLHHREDVETDENERPAKRARTMGEGKTARAPGGNSVVGRHAVMHTTVPGSPLPVVHSRTQATAGKETVRRRRRRTADRNARRANGWEPPSLGTRLPAPKQVADFAPWTGQHPEDVLTDAVIKAGYCDKPPGPNATESHSAKASLWPNLSAKNNMGLQTLSYLYTSVMEKRRVIGRVTAPSTFKPPPRVTVTDTKREAWLRDLANPEVPLRKQSRTIPHGIRGKLLMEQCLGKAIPMPRAVWLAKCVGANELRAFRRKGVSGAAAATGESQWLRDWTEQVETFVADMIAQCGQPEWQSKMDYAVRLATSFYVERLLERDHYLDWMVTSYAQASTDTLPIFILLIQLHWRDIAAYSRRGRRLAEATLEQLHQITQRTRGGGATALKTRLQKLVSALALTHRRCLIIPRTWQRYHYLLAPKSAQPDTAAQSITRRNHRISATLGKTAQNTRCALLQLYSVLDRSTISLDVNMVKLTAVCRALVRNLDELVSALLNWSASVYRTGRCRVYLVAKLIARLSLEECDTDSAILNYLTTARTTSIVASNVHMVIAELVREDRFSPSRYMQWLMTNGALSGSVPSPLCTGLLGSLPSTDLPPELCNTRNMLMRRLGVARDASETIDAIEAAAIDPALSHTLITAGGSLSAQAHQLTGAGRAMIARSIAQRVATLTEEEGLSASRLCVLQEIVEQFHDIRTLAEMVQVAMNTSDGALLATIGDMINMHAETFAVLESLPSMLNCVLARYRVLRSQQPLDRCLIIALTALAMRFPDKADFVRLLQNDLAICDQQNSIIVCSPASDSLVSMQASSLDSDTDIDAVFASGNTMDEHLTQRLFTRILQRAAKMASWNVRIPRKVCAWLTQLRAIDATGFDALARSYVATCLQTFSDDAVPLGGIIALIASGCASFDVVLSQARDAKTHSAASTTIRLLTTAVAAEDESNSAEAYRYRLQQKRSRSLYPEQVIPLLATAMQDVGFLVDDESCLVPLVVDYAVGHYQACLAALAASPQSTAFLGNCGRLLMKVLSLADQEHRANHVKLDAVSMIALADPLSILVCTGALAFLTKLETSRGSVGDSKVQSALLEAIANGCQVWPQLLEHVGQETLVGVYKWARDQVLGNPWLQDPRVSISRADLYRNLDILGVAHHAIKEQDGVSVMAVVADRLRTVGDRLSTLSSCSSVDSTSVICSLQVLLHLSVLYSTSTEVESENQRLSGSNLLAILCQLLTHSNLQRHQDVLEYMYDVASMLADNLPEETLSALAQNMARNGFTAPCLASILGYTRCPDSWLALAVHPQPPGSQQQRALLQKQAAAHLPMAVRQNAQQQQQQQASHKTLMMKSTEAQMFPFPLRRWDMMSDATPNVGDNDTSLSLSLFGARRV